MSRRRRRRSTTSDRCSQATHTTSTTTATASTTTSVETVSAPSGIRGGAYGVGYPRLSVAKKHRVRARSRRAVEASRRASAVRPVAPERESSRPVPATARTTRYGSRSGTSRAVGAPPQASNAPPHGSGYVTKDSVEWRSSCYRLACLWCRPHPHYLERLMQRSSSCVLAPELRRAVAGNSRSSARSRARSDIESRAGLGHAVLSLTPDRRAASGFGSALRPTQTCCDNKSRSVARALAAGDDVVVPGLV